ncbi:MAG TPA: copper resistance protein CopC [Nocardioidaceae bacterium]|nr:copper resistance protein CopC [Nocardioidaceae bacterium]
MRTHTRLAGLLVVLATAALSVVVTAPVATAHAELESTTPKQGSTVQRLPQQVTLTFSEPIRTPAFVEVTGPGSANVASGDVQVRDEVLTQQLGDAAGGGAYSLSYRVTSADGHPISGTVRFTVAGGAAGGNASGGNEQSTPAPTADSTEGAGGTGQNSTPAAPAEESGGLGTTQLVLLLGALVLGIAALAVGTRRALRHSSAMVDDANAKRTRRE